MKVNSISAFNFGDKNTNENKKPEFIDNFQTKLKNSADMSDCVSVPRTIFKGYLGIMAGTSLGTAAGLMKPSKIKTAVAACGIISSLYGTWAFARPYVIKDAVPTICLNA